MKAAVLKGAEEIAIELVKKPEIGPQEVLIDVKATGICGTDLGLYQHVPLQLPRILGHEVCGRIVEVGLRITQRMLGERVVIDPIHYCGSCWLCNRGKVNLCLNGGLRGRELEGGLAEYIAVGEGAAFVLNDDVPYSEATQIQTLSTVYHAQQRLNLPAGESVLILGLGVTGFLHLQLARLCGATPLIAATRSPWKLDLANQLGADYVLNTTRSDWLEQLKALTQGRGAATVVETVGHPATVKQAIAAAASGGQILQFGIVHAPLEDVDFYPVYYKELNLIGARAADRGDWEAATRLVGSGKINVQALITHELPLEQIETGLKLLEERSQRVLKVVLTQN